MVLIKNLILPVLFLLAGVMIAAGVGGCRRLLLEERDFNKSWRIYGVRPDFGQWKKRNRINIVLIVMGVMLLAACIFFGLKHVSVGDVPQGENDSATVTDDQYIGNISAEFGEMQPNMNYTKWEGIIVENLEFSIYETDKSLAAYENINGNILLTQDGMSSVEKIHVLYEKNADFFAEPTQTLNEINQFMSEQKDRKSIGVEIHKEEVMLYAGDIMGREDDLSREKIYQAGRAAQDVVDCLCRDPEADVKEIILYAALAKEYYAYALTMPVSNMKRLSRYNEYIFYRMGMLYDKLADYGALKEYREHFLLEAGSLYALSTTTGMGKEGMSQNHIYNVDFFRGRVLYYLYDMGWNDEGETARECIENFLKIKDEIPAEFQLSGVETSCDFILSRLGGK